MLKYKVNIFKYLKFFKKGDFIMKSIFKKTFAALMALAMVLGLAACGGNSYTADNTEYVIGFQDLLQVPLPFTVLQFKTLLKWLLMKSMPPAV